MNQFTNNIPHIGENFFMHPGMVRPIPVSLPFTCVAPKVPSIHEMTIEETAAWIRRLACSKQWEEADEYVKSFIEKQITGRRLVEQTLHSLATDLKIRKLGHRFNILEAIADYVTRSYGVRGFADCKPQCVIEMSSLSDVGRQMQSNPRLVQLKQNPCSLETVVHSDGYCPSKLSQLPGYDTAKGDLERMSQSCRSLSIKGVGKRKPSGIPPSTRSLDPPRSTRHSWKTIPETSSISTSKRFCSNSPHKSQQFSHSNEVKLILTYYGSEEINSVIYKHFREFGYDVQVEPMQDNPFGYVILFRSAEEAEGAFKKRHIFDYKLDKYKSAVDNKEKGGVPPSQEKPTLYKILNRTTVRSGIEKTSEIVRDLYKGELVSVDKVEGNRAHIVEINDKGVFEEFGWASLSTDCGIQLLIPFTF